MSTSPDEQGTALGLERLRGELTTGLARIEGALSVLVVRSEQAEKATAAHSSKLETHDARLDGLEAAQAAAASHSERLTAVERRVWTIGGGITVVAVGVELAVNFVH